MQLVKFKKILLFNAEFASGTKAANESLLIGYSSGHRHARAMSATVFVRWKFSGLQNFVCLFQLFRKHDLVAVLVQSRVNGHKRPFFLRRVLCRFHTCKLRKFALR